MEEKHDKYWTKDCGEYIISDKPLGEMLDEILPKYSPPFKPNWHLNSHGRFINVIWENVSYYFKECNEYLGYYMAQDDNRIIGVKLYNVIGNIPSLQEQEEWEKRDREAMKKAVEKMTALKKSQKDK